MVKTVKNIQYLPLTFFEGEVLLFHFLKTIEFYVLFIILFQAWKNMKACVHPDNQS